jgi:hypothetical protein
MYLAQLQIHPSDFWAPLIVYLLSQTQTTTQQERNMSWDNAGSAGGGWDGAGAGATNAFEEPAATNGFDYGGAGEEGDGAAGFEGAGGAGRSGGGCYNW